VGLVLSPVQNRREFRKGEGSALAGPDGMVRTCDISHVFSDHMSLVSLGEQFQGSLLART